MGKNAKLNRELAKLSMALSREDLYYYICYKVEKYLTYKKTCRIANEIVLSNGFKCMTSFDDREMDANYNKLLAMAKIKNFTFDIKDEDIIVNINEVNECLRNLCYINMEWVEEHDFAFDELDIDAETKELSIYRFFNNIMENLKKLELGESIIELKTFIEYFNELYNDFDKEKECKDLFRQNIKDFSYKIDNINKVVRDIYLQIDDIKYNYNLSDEDINKFSILNKNLEKINQDYKILVDQGKMKTFAYSKLVDELNGLSLKLSRLQDDLDFQLRSITSMKDDETRAREQLATIENLLKKAKYRLKDYKIPVIPSSYYIELTEAQDAIREIIKELDRKPIVIKILNIRVDTARDLVFKIYNKTNDMIKIASMSEKIIIYGNRYRSSYEEIDIALTKAEELFKRGKYKESLDLSMKSLSFIDKNVTEKF